MDRQGTSWLYGGIPSILTGLLAGVRFLLCVRYNFHLVCDSAVPFVGEIQNLRVV